MREEIRLEFQRKISELVEKINLIAATIEGATKQEILVIIDDIDKLDLKLVRELFQEQIKALFQPNFRIIFTVPISALRQVTLRQTIVTETNDQIVFMPVSKLFTKENAHQQDGITIEKNFNRLKEILYKRLPAELVEPATAEKIILASGGVLRELIRIANGCCRICLRLVRRQPEETIKINQTILKAGIKKQKFCIKKP